MCTTANLATCVPACNAVTYGFLLSIEIDGRGTVMTCNKHGDIYSWQGQASLGGYIGRDIKEFQSSVISGAAGTFVATVGEDGNILTPLTIRPRQIAQIYGDRALPAKPTWGSGGFIIEKEGSLALNYIALLSMDRTTAIVQVASGGRMSVMDSSLVPVHGIPTHFPCAATAGSCRGPHTGPVVVNEPMKVSLAVPLACTFWTDNCGALPAGVTIEQHNQMVADTVSTRTPMFTVLSGPCTIDPTSDCVGRPSGFSESEACAIVPTSTFTLSSCSVFHLTDFRGLCPSQNRSECCHGLTFGPSIGPSTECSYRGTQPGCSTETVCSPEGYGNHRPDHLRIDGTEYVGRNCPYGIQVTASSTISWESNGRGTGRMAWQICAPAGSSGATISPGVAPAADPICFAVDQHIAVPDDPQFSVNAGSGDRDDCAPHWPFGLAPPDGGDGPGWYRLPPGKGLPTAPVGGHKCSTGKGVWLSNNSVSFHSAQLTASQLVTETQAIKTVDCGSFMLWQLPPLSVANCELYSTTAAYCLADGAHATHPNRPP